MAIHNQYLFNEKKYILDKGLYKYFSNENYAFDCVKNKQVHLDNPYDFNDPFDDGVYNCGIGSDGKEETNGI